jgi:hypothetical protein
MSIVSFAFATSSIAWAQTYTTIDYPGAIATTLNGGPNPQGTSVGTETDTSGVIHGFTLTKQNVFTPFDPPGSTSTTPNGINPLGVIVGGYVDSTGVTHGFILRGGQYTTIDFQGALFTTLGGLGPSGTIVGSYSSVSTNPLCNNGPSGACHSFQISNEGVFTSFDPPGATSSSASSVNPFGAVVGNYNDSSGVGHGYLLEHGTYTAIDFPGATSTFVGYNNAEGDIVGEYPGNGVTNFGHAFLLSNGVFASFDIPGAIFTDAAGINPSGIIVGPYFDSAVVEHGFIRTP